MTRSPIGELWLDLYDTVAMLQALGNDTTTYEEDRALETISLALDTKDPKWHESLMQDMLENLDEDKLSDLLDNLSKEDELDDNDSE